MKRQAKIEIDQNSLLIQMPSISFKILSKKSSRSNNQINFLKTYDVSKYVYVLYNFYTLEVW